MPSFRSRSIASRSSHGNSVAASLLHLWSLKQVEPLTLQICANQAFTWRNQPHRRAPRSPVRKTKKSGHPKLCHAPQLSPEKLPRAASDSLTSRSCSCTRAAMMALSTTDLPTEEIWLSTDVACASTRHLDFWLLLHAPVNIARSSHAPILLLMSSDVIWWHHHSTSAATQARPRQRHVIGWRQRIYYLTRDPTWKPETNQDQYPLTLTLD